MNGGNKLVLKGRTEGNAGKTEGRKENMGIERKEGRTEGKKGRIKKRAGIKWRE